MPRDTSSRDGSTWPCTRLEDPATPMTVVDLDAFDANAADLARRAAGKPVRVASKSLRVPALVERALGAPGFAGVLAYSLREAIWLVREGITDDAVMGYPTVDRAALTDLLGDDDATRPSHADGRRPGAPVADRGRRTELAPARAGRHRHRRGPADGAVARRSEAVTAVRRGRGRRLRARGARPRVLARRGDDLRGPGGRSTGRRTQPTRQVPRRTQAEVGVGRAARGATCRDRGAAARRGASWSSGTPAAPAASSPPWPTRWSPRSRPGRACWCRDCSTTTRASSHDRRRSSASRSYAAQRTESSRSPGGGFIASGPTGKDRAPLPWAPPDLHLTGLEGAGEVQTPLTGFRDAPAADR